MTSPPSTPPRRQRTKDLTGKLTTQVGPRTTAPMWVRPLLTVGEWAIYSALWSYPDGSYFPTHQDLSDRAWCERGSAANAIARFDELGLVKRERQQRPDGSDSSNTYELVEVCTPALAKLLVEKQVERAAEQEKKRKSRKAKNRVYAAKTAESDEAAETSKGGTPQDVPPSEAVLDGGTPQDVPPGYTTPGTPGGTPPQVPRGYTTGGTHESLGSRTKTKRKTLRPSASTGGTAASSSAESPEDPEIISSLTADQEDALALVDDVNFFPTDLTAWEQALIDECCAIVGERWGKAGRHLRKVLGTPLIRSRTAADPDLARRAFLAAARDPETTSPSRMLYLDKCPHWNPADGPVPEVEPVRAPVQRAGGAGMYAGPVGEQAVAAQTLPPSTSPPDAVAEMFAKAGLRPGKVRERADASS